MVTASRSTLSDPAGERAEDFARAFREDGFVHVPRLLSDQEVAQLRPAAVDAVTAKGEALEHNDTMRSLARHASLRALAERLAGMPLRVWGGEVLLKQPHDAPTGLHDDQFFEPPGIISRISLNAWVALVDVPVESGCLTFFPGSHRREGPERIGLDPAGMSHDDANSYLFRHWPEMRWAPRVTIPVRAGDVTFHHRRTAHCAGANQTRGDRIAIVVKYTDAAATYRHPEWSEARPPRALCPTCER